MNILITGGNGFIGRNIMEKGIGSYNLYFGSTSLESNNNIIKFKKNYKNISNRLDSIEIDIIVHLAAEIPNSLELSNYQLYVNNVEIMENIYKYINKKNVKKIIYLSTFGTMETKNNYDIKDYYTLSKIVGEHYCSMLSAKGVRATVLRISSPYGIKNCRNSVLDIFLRKALNNENIDVYGSGTRTQNFIYIEDIIQAIKLSINNFHFEGICNILSNKSIDMLTLAKTIKAITNSSSSIFVGRKDDPQDSFRQMHKINSNAIQLGYQPRFAVESGIKAYLNEIVNENGSSPLK